MRGLRRGAVLALFLSATALAGCGERDLSKPPKVLYGRDVCAQCRMIIQDERYAAASVSADGQYFKFDDIGCMARHEKEAAGRGPGSWVHDGVSGQWIETGQATFAHARDLVTPMGYGLMAFAAADDAEKWSAKQGGRVLVWDELKQEVVK